MHPNILKLGSIVVGVALSTGAVFCETKLAPKEPHQTRREPLRVGDDSGLVDDVVRAQPLRTGDDGQAHKGRPVDSYVSQDKDRTAGVGTN